MERRDDSTVGTLSSDNLGSTTYAVSFFTIDGQTSPSAYPAGQGRTSLSGSWEFFNANSDGLSTSSADEAATATRQAFQLLIRSTGKWQSATDVLDFVTETIEVGCRTPTARPRPHNSGSRHRTGDRRFREQRGL